MKRLSNFLLTILIFLMIPAMIPANAKTLANSNVTTQTQNNYKDIQGTWFEKWASEYGYKDIFSDDNENFYPHKSITRMEFARLIHKSLNIKVNYLAETDIGDYFTDVNNSDIGKNELYDLVNLGIIDDKDKFRPFEPLTRGEMTRYAMNAFFYSVGEDYAIANQNFKNYSDDSDIIKDYKRDVQLASNLGIINGRGDNLLKPLEASTRAEAVTTVGRLIEKQTQISSSVVVKASAKEVEGELILSLSIINNTDKKVSFSHGYGQYFDFKIYDKSGNEIYHWAEDKMFPMMLVSTDIEPSKEVEYSDKVDLKEFQAIKDKIFEVKAFVVGTSENFEINQDGYIVSNVIFS